jgi:hypothetical protein
MAEQSFGHDLNTPVRKLKWRSVWMFEHHMAASHSLDIVAETLEGTNGLYSAQRGQRWPMDHC